MAEIVDKKISEYKSTVHSSTESLQYADLEEYGSFISSTAATSQDYSILSPDENILLGVLSNKILLDPSEPEGMMQDSTAIEDGEMWTEENIAVLRNPVGLNAESTSATPSRDSRHPEILDDAFVLGRTLSSGSETPKTWNDQVHSSGQMQSTDFSDAVDTVKVPELSGVESWQMPSFKSNEFVTFSSGIQDSSNTSENFSEIHFQDQYHFIEAEQDSEPEAVRNEIQDDSIIQWASPTRETLKPFDDQLFAKQEKSESDTPHNKNSPQAPEKASNEYLPSGSIMEYTGPTGPAESAPLKNNDLRIDVDPEKETVPEVLAGPILSGREHPTASTSSPIIPEPIVELAGTIQDSTVPLEIKEIEAMDKRFTPEFVKEISDMFMYLDRLLESLPDAKIEEFARSSHFDAYRHIFEVLGLV